ncbi:alpha/beta fold hydrolase [Olleya sp. YS]|uniref:alpha/beta fold hydrolase n=1 Tax=Olleya sp. YS TaxID=3028318 RepID=UPI0024344BAF|nr:alpha/beta fold hydrolase [Olleya sp. YS]WGD35289.1 alpha/beta fold hydrolase [Olleya sp. YS]
MQHLKYINITNYNLQNGKTVDIKLSYQVFGKPLHTAPIVLVNHALTGNSNVVGADGWWSDLIGDNKCIDTQHYTILAFNIPGNGFDNTEDHLIDNYKDFTASSIAQIFVEGLNQLLINKLFAVIGGSVGGGIAWELAVLQPNLIQHVIPIATDWKATDWLIANCHIQDAILNHSSQPLEDARMHAMTLYRTPESLTRKFQRTQQSDTLFEVESWLNYHGNQLSNRFQLSAYKVMNQVLRTIDITKGRGSFKEVASKINSSIHIITINSDLFFKAEENWETYIDLKSVKQNVTIGEIKSIHGHDAFLIEYDQLSKLLHPIFEIESYEKKHDFNTLVRQVS